jgi:hypothetical protein
MPSGLGGNAQVSASGATILPDLLPLDRPLLELTGKTSRTECDQALRPFRNRSQFAPLN